MARFGVFRNPDAAGYLLDVQADLLGHLNTRVVVPLLPLNVAPTPAKTLNPVFEVDGESVVMATQFLAAVPASLLRTGIASLEGRRHDITAALDLLFQGF
ncbi:MAG TPA: CcdB family protein [Zoogloea sp.]|jgi:toxin CcdB|nr:CcdB family protein [Zoogloea sp.]HOB45670.1 CcdB family protein [Zoogloea sp.]